MNPEPQAQLADLEGWDVAPVEQAEEQAYLETATPEELRSDVEDLLHALRKIVNISPQSIPGGPTSKNFGKRFIISLGKVQEIAAKVLVAQAQREGEREHRVHEEVAHVSE